MTQATPFHKILVANRGEIALRVMRTAHALGYRTVAVYSEADAGAPHVLAADEAVAIGAAPPAQSYLNIGALIEAARASGADAVHPGYGFLAENAAFAQACHDAGLVFIGPSPQAIRAMGDKAGAKRLMAAAGVPCIPGFQSENPADQTPERLTAEAARIGYPVMIKATAGGGGRGMRRVDAPGDFAAALRSAQSEAQHAFGDATVILERALESPRHIEIQVFADRHGQALHLGERDCSVQRRHQKLIEEAPSPAVDEALRAAMGATAVAAVRAIGYEGAGTLEFLLDEQGRYYFMEMNTRLQVEHPVTEALTGLDLVAWQLRVAAGEPLPLQQHEIGFQGHAIEVRLCAEDAARGFMPCSGTVQRWQPPPGLRVEHALCDGAAVPPHYDSMIAKLVAHGPTRADARRRLLRGLHELVALGLPTNQSFLARCLEHPGFAAGAATTDFITRHQDELLRTDDTAQRQASLLAAWLLRATQGADPAVHGPHADGQRSAPAPTLTHGLPVGLRLALNGEDHALRLTERAPGRFELALAGALHELQAVAVDAHQARCIIDGVMRRVIFHRDGAQLWLAHDGQAHAVEDRTCAATARRGEAGGDGRVRAAMSGRVVAVLVAPGEAVQAGQAVLTLEAMKMEHAHHAPVAGVVAALHAAAGDQVAAGRVVVEINPAA
ncbi:acetyl-CoA carboxylase biotin carboxylase subunit [Roseateles sp.]|jgi:geranyl-CoA carboxylase alpha subunit|uniref:acetyl-CoA carboxylase biotin carboxylase subunit n=1 Tax=Roseateles sp. TaxID=1971397 RepID=UPI003BA551DB